jgi:hypothetical protein
VIGASNLAYKSAKSDGFISGIGGRIPQNHLDPIEKPKVNREIA